MKALMILPATLLTLGCTALAEPEATPSTEAVREPTTTTAPPTTTTTTAPAPPPAPRPGTAFAEYESNLDYLSGYCYSDCGRIDPDTWDYYLDRASDNGLGLAVATLADMTYRDLDTICSEFWATPDADIASLFASEGVTDTDAVLASLYYVCDS